VSTTTVEEAVPEQTTLNGEPVGAATEIVTPRKPTKIEMKRQQQYMERRKRLMNKGVPESEVDRALAEEEYRNLPVEKKFERFANAMNGAVQSLAKDIMGLRHNDGVLADAMDLNFKAVARALEKAGVPLQLQGEIIKQAEIELRAERQRQFEEQQAAARAQAQAHAQAAEQNVAAELAKAEGKELTPEAPPPAEPPPEGATTFGG
jgi:hypothetical protein